jgi:hypothetical protein
MQPQFLIFIIIKIKNQLIIIYLDIFIGYLPYYILHLIFWMSFIVIFFYK